VLKSGVGAVKASSQVTEEVAIQDLAPSGKCGGLKLAATNFKDPAERICKAQEKTLELRSPGLAGIYSGIH
jgi:hypothetical protein